VKRGRKPKSLEEKRATGNPGKRKLNRRAPKIAEGFPLPVLELGKHASRAWDARVEQIFPTGALKPTDSFALTLMAVQEGYASRWFEGFEEIAPTQTGESSEQVNAALRARLAILKELRLWLQLFGCTPGSRGQIIADGKDPDQRDEEEASRPWHPEVLNGGRA